MDELEDKVNARHVALISTWAPSRSRRVVHVRYDETLLRLIRSLVFRQMLSSRGVATSRWRGAPPRSASRAPRPRDAAT